MTTTQFKVGDLVECIDDSFGGDYIVQGNFYQVVEIVSNQLVVKDFNKQIPFRDVSWLANQFRLVGTDKQKSPFEIVFEILDNNKIPRCNASNCERTHDTYYVIKINMGQVVQELTFCRFHLKDFSECIDMFIKKNKI